MPGFDGTGPGGIGPMTGGGRGWCNPYSPPYAGYAPYPAPYAYGPYYAPGAGMPAGGYGFRPLRRRSLGLRPWAPSMGSGGLLGSGHRLGRTRPGTWTMVVRHVESPSMAAARERR